MNIVLFEKNEISCPLKLNDERAQHILKILHKKEGDTFSCGIIKGMAGKAEIIHISEEGIKFSFQPESDGKPLNPLKMIIGFPRPIQLKRLLRDVAALGIQEIHLTGTELGEKSYMKSNLLERGTAYKMLLDGTVQAASTHIPELFLHQNLKECLQEISKNPAELKIALDNVNASENLFSFMQNRTQKFPVIAAIGSERGWTNNERQLLEKSGFTRCSMGQRIMRTETAATVASSIILASSGFLK
ncbi:MAG: 16S rRNA (uracil(1498)-N(3))-methyltransferase [Spirochaetia bacterium]|nr:16S rRNA (uracil(1498)-N(3))-methyltransferase [Spirochaetia bacterium]